MNYCTVAQVREELAKDAAVSATFGVDDPAIAERIPRACELIDQFCGHSLAYELVVREVRRREQVAITPDGALRFTVSHARVESISALEFSTNFAVWSTVKTDAVDIVPTNNAAYTVDVYNVALPATRGVRMFVRVSYQAGWPATPYDIEHAASRLTAFLFMKRSAPFEAIAAQNGAVFLPTSMPKDIADALKPYRRVTP